MRASPLLALALLGLATAAGAAGFSSLEERMSEQEFRDAGLEKLAPEELDRLNAWLRTHASGPDAGDSVGFRSSAGLFNDDAMDRGEIVARIVGEFSGFSNGSILELDNGQAWEITDGQLAIPAVSGATVTIKPAMLGSWLLAVDGYNRTARVRRVR